jgi:hypothetical protein
VLLRGFLMLVSPGDSCYALAFCVAPFRLMRLGLGMARARQLLVTSWVMAGRLEQARGCLSSAMVCAFGGMASTNAFGWAVISSNW